MALPVFEGPCLVAGDFNLYHDSWAAEWWAGTTTAQAAAFGDVLEAEEWELGLEKGSITRMSEGGGSALDLVLVNQALEQRGWMTSCEVRPDLSAGSDHWPVVTTLRCGKGQPLRREKRFRFAQADWDEYRRQLEATRASYLEPSLSHLQTRRAPEHMNRNIDQLAEAMQQWIFAAMAAAVPSHTDNGAGSPVVDGRMFDSHEGPIEAGGRARRNPLGWSAGSRSPRGGDAEQGTGKADAV
ncbi:hypothetical protein CF336_g7779 [Tilletia laevis]|nr:hypothetical protein CF336_g7779 [Tilletia laevis]